ncbi:MAG: hypothetical protein IJJ74_06980 [Eubacterium sp.]|nr:hypothetical protein [Eubacterium sp.]
MKGSDFRAIRVLPYVTVLLMAVMHTVAIVLDILGIRISMYSGEGAYKFLGTLVSYVNSFKHVVMIGVFICLYRLSRIAKNFYYAWVTSLAYMVTGVLTQVFSWIADISGNNVAANSVALIVSLLPDICAAFVIYSLIKGEAEVYRSMDRHDKADSVRKLASLWIYVETGVLSSYYLLFTICTIARRVFQFDNVEIPGVLSAFSYIFTIILSAALLMYIYIVIRVWLTTRHMCYDYYLYNYNNQVAGGR